jgi:hypothetical protein
MTTLLRRIKNAFEIFEIFEYIKQFLFEMKIFLLVVRWVNWLEYKINISKKHDQSKISWNDW